MTHKKLRDALRVKYGPRCYRITRTGEVHIYGPMPNSRVTGWWLMGDIDHAYTRLGIDA
jgi:hypothetical protein